MVMRDALSPSDQVRAFCKVTYIDPARQRGDTSVSIRAGDVHSALDFRNRFPLVCAALGTTIFEELCGVRRASIDGPVNGSNTVFTFVLRE